jgi:sulfate adenylyltransferase
LRGNSIPKPHGDKLINRFVTTKRDINETLSVKVTDDLRNDIENIADGIFSPLEGFVGEDEFRSIVQFGRLKNGLPWTIPIILDVDETTATQMKDAVEVILSTYNESFGLIKVEEVYSFDKLDVAKAIYNTTDINQIVSSEGRLNF